MTTADVSLITYTYNDGHFVDGLLRELTHWPLTPREVVVVDDGSTQPYTPPSCPVPVHLVRHPTNQGIPATKHEAISAGTSTFLLAMDCDTRVVADWLAYCLPQANRPDVGLVSGPVEYLSGEDLISRFQRCFGDNHNLDRAGVTDFVPGNVFLLRRAVWEACGGMRGFAGEVCEDHFLCGRIRSLGLQLWVEPGAQARQIRRISRLAMLQRYWKWCREPVTRRALESGDIPGYVLAILANPLAERLETAITMEEPMFLYLEAVYLSYGTLDLLDTAITQGKADSGLKAAWWAELSRLFRPYPALWALLRADLASLGQMPAAPLPDGPNPFAACFTAFDALRSSKVFDWIARHGIPAMLTEEAAQPRDFSFYATAAQKITAAASKDAT